MSSCCICLEDYDGSTDTNLQLAVIVTCKHWFHFTCISKWISNSNASCPLCKSHAKASDVIHMPLEVSRGLLLSCRNLSTDNSIENDWNAVMEKREEQLESALKALQSDLAKHQSVVDDLQSRLISSEEKCADLVKTVEESKAKLKDFKRLKRQLQEKNSNLERQHKMLTSENEVFREEKYTLMNKIVDLKSELEEVKEQAARSQVFSRHFQFASDFDEREWRNTWELVKEVAIRSPQDSLSLLHDYHKKVGEIQSQLIDGRERTKRLKSWKDEAKAKTEELVRVNQHLSEQNANIKTDLEFSNAKMQHILEQIEYEREKNENLRQENEEWQRNLGHVVDIPPVMEEFGNLDTIDRQDFGSERKLLQPSQSNNTKIQRPGASSMKRQQSLKCFLPEPKKSTSSSDINQSKRPTSKHSIAKFVRIS